MNSYRRLMVLLLSVLLFSAACSQSKQFGEATRSDGRAPVAQRQGAPLGDIDLPPLQLSIQEDGTFEADITAEALFDLNSTALKPEAEEIVTQLGEHLARGSFSVRVDGYTDGFGSEEHNLQLSLGRAQSLATRVEQLGTAAQVQACGRGEEGTDGESEDPSARRVVITLSTNPFPEDCS